MKILIVEDEIKISSYLKRGLEEEGYSIDLAQEGDTGLQMAMSAEYDLLILDILLPKRDGWSVLKELRAAKKKTLVLFLTARDELADRVQGLELGADAYLVKPFAFSELRALVKSLLRRSIPKETGTLLSVEDLTLDLIHRVAIRSGVRLDLTPKEFSFLHLLASRRGETISRTTISEQIWNIHYDPGSNSVEVHIGRLRAKVDDPWERKLIKTVRGFGYQIVNKE